ncbi:hypothetical protein [Methanothermobacter sp.]|uniref:hypothetical protein n=1 Tax=Methanothermobacter sp. TaxID=1884223 RepID=UPI002603D14E|nr:hypothetical protein [Methanothermobacter sp.]MDI9617696.1 hypothetical protein [Methanothermobacter sp.]
MTSIFSLRIHPGRPSQGCPEGLSEAGHTYGVRDLYRMKFRSELSQEEYLREISQDAGLPLSGDVMGGA